MVVEIVKSYCLCLKILNWYHSLTAGARQQKCFSFFVIIASKDGL